MIIFTYGCYLLLVSSLYFSSDDGYSSSNSCSTSLKESLYSHVEVESSNTTMISIVVTDAPNFEKQLASMKGMLLILSKESVEKDAQIKC